MQKGGGARVRLAACVTGAALVAATGAGCGSNLAQGIAQAPEWQKGKPVCETNAKGHSTPLLAEWEASDRTKLEALAKDGMVAVHYEGCTIEVLPECKGPGAYKYVGTNLQHEQEHIKNADDLYAKLPFGAAHLEGALERAGELSVAMTIVGQYEAERKQVAETDLTGSCAKATHVVVALTTGAFTLATGAQAKVAASVDTGVFGGANGDSSSDRQTLSTDGFEKACEGAKLDDPKPVAGCGAILRMEVVPLPGAEQRLAQDDARYEDARSAAAGRRTAGYIVTGVGVGLGGLAGLFAYLGSQQNKNIQGGGFATSKDITDAQSRGSTYNTMSWIFGGIGVAFAAVGVPLIVFNPDPQRTSVGIAAAPMPGGGGGVVVEVR